MRQVRGFTLIELMIVVAILAILVALAIALYRDYTTRAQVAEAVELVGGLKAPLAEYGANTSAWPTAIVAPPANPASSQIAGTLVGNYASVTNVITGTYPVGQLEATMTVGLATGGTILFDTSDGGGTWTCTAGTVLSKYRPQACR